ncbi:MAG TPA: hypothetical protein VNO56_08330 [Gaiellaceae bacterium]|nr:hypothetical protein [Gaiellaceae bacterium]
MKREIARRRARTFALAGVVAVLAAGTAAPAGARPSSGPTVDVQSVAWLAPDGGSVSFQVIASCPERWSVVQAVVAVSQPQASGQASFPLACVGSLRVFNVTVPASSGTFTLGQAQASASVVIQRGKTQRTTDSQLLQVDPAVLVELAESALIESGGGAVTMDLTVACPVGATGLESRLGVSQGETRGVGTYTPVCDGSRHTFTVRVEATRGVYQAGIAQALTFADVEFDGRFFSGVDDDGALELVP